MSILPEQLQPRVELIAHLCAQYGEVGDKAEWWGDYHQSEGLDVAKWTDTFVDFRRTGTGSATVYLEDVQPSGVRDVKESDPVELDSKVIDATSIRSDNVKGTSPAMWEYTGEFEQTTSKRHSFEAGFQQSVTNTFTAGSDASAVKNELSVSLGFSQTTTDESEKTERQNRTFAFSGATPSGEGELITAWRKVSRMRSVVTGIGNYEHSIKIGKHWHGSWQGGRHSWKTFADFVRTVKGEAPSDWDLAEQFRSNPVPQRLIDQLEAPLDVPYTLTLEFDQATVIDTRKRPLGKGE